MSHPSDNIGVWPDRRAVRSGDRIALVSGEDRVTYAELARRSAGAAGALRDLGVSGGDRVAVVLRNRSEFIELLFAATRIGAMFVPLNYRLSTDEIEYALRDSGASVVLGQTAIADTAVAAAQRAGVRYLSVDGPQDEYHQLRDRATPAEPVLVAPADPAMILYTSGTSGPPKGAMISHENTLFNVFNYVADYGIRGDDVTVVVNPIFHVVLHILTMPLLFLGGTVVLGEEFSASGTLHLMETERATVMFAIPTAWQMIVEDPGFEAFDSGRLRFVGSGGAAAPPALMATFARRGIPYRQGYGLTEVTSSGTVMEPADQATKAGSIGRPFFGVQARIVAADGSVCGPGGQGELELRGRSIARAYWNKPIESTETFGADGWFRTGDIAYRDADGFIFLVDRKKDIIISGGENVSSVEVEHALLAHPAVAEAAVIGVPHERWGETPRAIVVVREEVSGEALIAFSRERIAHYKCPSSVVFVDALPKTATGKVAKPQLRATYGTGAVAASLRGADAPS